MNFNNMSMQQRYRNHSLEAFQRYKKCRGLLKWIWIPLHRFWYDFKVEVLNPIYRNSFQYRFNIILIQDHAFQYHIRSTSKVQKVWTFIEIHFSTTNGDLEIFDTTREVLKYSIPVASTKLSNQDFPYWPLSYIFGPFKNDNYVFMLVFCNSINIIDDTWEGREELLRLT